MSAYSWFDQAKAENPGIIASIINDEDAIRETDRILQSLPNDAVRMRYLYEAFRLGLSPHDHTLQQFVGLFRISTMVSEEQLHSVMDEVAKIVAINEGTKRAFDEQIGQLAGKITELNDSILEAKKMTAAVNGSVGAVKRLAGETQDAMTSVTNARIAQIENLIKTVPAQLTDVLAEVRTHLVNNAADAIDDKVEDSFKDALGQVVDQLRSQVQATIDRVNASLGSINQITDSLGPRTDAAAKSLDAVGQRIEGLSTTLDEANEKLQQLSAPLVATTKAFTDVQRALLARVGTFAAGALVGLVLASAYYFVSLQHIVGNVSTYVYGDLAAGRTYESIYPGLSQSCKAQIRSKIAAMKDIPAAR